MSGTREVVSEKERVARDLIKSHPLTSGLSAEFFAQKGIIDFQVSTANIEWSKSELEGLQKVWVQAYGTYHGQLQNLHTPSQMKKVAKNAP